MNDVIIINNNNVNRVKFSEHMFKSLSLLEMYATKNATKKPPSNQYIKRLTKRLAKYISEKKIDPNIKNKDGQTVLWYACEYKLTEELVLLLRAGTKVNIRDKSDDTALHMACGLWNGFTEGVELLLKAGANPNIKNNNGETPLHVYLDKCTRDKVEIIELLFKAGGTLNVRDKNGNTPLLLACRSRYIKGVETLLKGNANPSIKNKKGSSALDIASDIEFIEGVELLL